MKNQVKKIKKGNGGITLIALVITVVILLILASVLINLSIGNNGLFTRAKLAKQKYEYAQEKEIIELKLLDIQAECRNENEEYGLTKISEVLGESQEIEIIKYYESIGTVNSNAGSLTLETTGIGVKVIKHTNYTFLIGNKGTIEGVTTENNPTIDKFVEITTFEEELNSKISSIEGQGENGGGQTQISIPIQSILYNSETFRNELFSSNYSNGTEASYEINSDGLLTIIGAYCNRNFGAFKVDLTDVSSVVVEWKAQNKTENTIGCVILDRNTGFQKCEDIAISTGVEKYEYNTSTTEFTTTTFDVSDLSGTHYIGVFGFESGFYAYIKSITLTYVSTINISYSLNNDTSRKQIISNQAIFAEVLKSKDSAKILLDNNIDDICQSEEAMRTLGQSETAKELIKNSSTYCSAINDSEYWKKVYTKTIPIMTSNTTPNGEASGTTGVYVDYYYAFDKQFGVDAFAGFSANNSYLQYTFEDMGIVPKKIEYYNWSDNGYGTTSNIEIKGIKNISESNEIQLLALNNLPTDSYNYSNVPYTTDRYKYIRLYITKENNTYNTVYYYPYRVYEFNVYGL